MRIRLSPPLPPPSIPDSIEVHSTYNGQFLGTIRVSNLHGGVTGYSFLANPRLQEQRIGLGKNVLRDIADACEQANKLRGVDYV